MIASRRLYKHEGMDRVRRGIPPMSSLLTGEDAGMAAVGAGVNAYGYAILADGATVAGTAAVGAPSFGASLVGVVLYRGARQNVSTPWLR